MTSIEDNPYSRPSIKCSEIEINSENLQITNRNFFTAINILNVKFQHLYPLNKNNE